MDKPKVQEKKRRVRTIRAWKKAQHEHQDPRFAAGHPDARWQHPHLNVRNSNFGAARVRMVGRMNPIVNWYRRAAH